MSESSLNAAVVVFGAVACGWIATTLKSRIASSSYSVPESIKFRHLLVYSHSILRNPQKSIPHYLRSIPLSKLFGAESGSLILKDVMSWDYVPDNYTDMGFLLTKNRKLYILSHAAVNDDVDWDWIDPSRSLSMTEYDIISHDESSVLINKIRSTSPMPSRFRQINPIMVEIGDLIYVLSRDDMKPPSLIEEFENFQAYNPKTDTWQFLPPPPWEVQCPSQFIVLDSKLCVSSESFSSAFDTRTNEWQACGLFHDFIMKDEEDFCGCCSMDCNLNQEHAWMDPVDLEVLGPPFIFEFPGLVVYEKFLVCTLAVWYPGLLAFILEDGKISKSSEPQVLLGWEEFKEGIHGHGSFVDLGDGYICLTLMDTECTWNKFITFRVLLAEDGQSLICDETKVSLVYVDGYVKSTFAC